MALPFNLIAVITLLTIQPPDINASGSKLESVDNSCFGNLNVTLTADEEISTISWIGVGRGIAVSMGQVIWVLYLLFFCTPYLYSSMNDAYIFSDRDYLK